jgi:MtN3 and saliva related transmembrane protein
MMDTEIVGFVAGLLTAGSLVPQVHRSFRTKSTKDISLYWLVINLCGQALWIAYGVLISSAALYVMSGFVFLMTAVMVVLKLKHGMGRKHGRKTA